MIRAGDVVLLCVLTLLSIGVIMVHSAGLTIDADQAVTLRSILLSRSTAYMALGVAAMAGVGLLPIRRLVAPAGFSRWTPALIPLMFLALALVYVPGIGKEANGSYRWVRLPFGDVTMQPSEIAKWSMIVVLAWYCRRFAQRMHEFRHGLLPALVILAGASALVAREDLGTGVLIGAAGCVVLLAGGARFWHVASLAPAALAAIGALVVASPYRIQRLLAFRDPFADPEGAGYHMIQSLAAVANGEVFGRGLGFGLQKFGYLPEDRTDFLFAVITEELGIAGALVVCSLYAALIWSGYAIVKREREEMLKLAGLGIIATIGLQAIMNLMVVTGLAPTKGIALPLLSSGGTGWILTAASLGLLIAMDREQANQERVEREATRAGVPARAPRAEVTGVAA